MLRALGKTRVGPAVVAVLCLATPASRASVGGTSPTTIQTFTVQGSANTTGASLMASDGFGVNIALLPESNANLTNVPADAVVAGAWLFWSGSEPQFSGGPDNTIRFSTPGGFTWFDLSTNACQPGESPCDLSQNRCVEARTATVDVDFFYCRRNVTGLLARIPTGQLGGSYVVGDVEADPGQTQGGPGQCDNNDPNCQAKYAGWSLVVVWQSPSSVVMRDAVLADGFLFADEDFFTGPGGGTGISPQFTMSGFSARANARAELSMFALEGDRQLGVPPQNVNGNPLFCTTCFDFLEISSNTHPTPWRVTDGTMLNPPTNLFNSSNKNGGDSTGVDVDSFNIGQGAVERVIAGGDTNLRFVLGSGDGQPGGDNGGGELVFLGYVFLALDTDAPRLSNAGTFKSASVTTASPGDLISYTIRVTNDGAANATNVRVSDPLPAGAVYVPNSTTSTCMANTADVGGASPLTQPGGLNLGTIAFNGATRFCEVRFQVRVSMSMMSGTIRNVATISADDIMSFPVEASTTVVAPVLSRFEKTVSGATGGGASPGDTLTYTLTVFGNGSTNVNGVSVVDQLPAALQGVTVTSRPVGSTLVSDVTTGRLQVDNITVPANGNAVITFTAQVRAGTADGTLVPNQGSLTFPGGGPLLSNDPNTMTAADPTVVTVLNRITLTTSTKTVLQPTGGIATAGSTVRWRVRVVNSGNRNATVTLADDIPANLGSCTVISAPPGVTCGPGGANGTGVVGGTLAVSAGNSVDVELSAVVLATAPDGFIIINRANLTPTENPAAAFTAVAAPITVQNRPSFTTSTKTVADLNGAPTRPGDTIRYTITVTNSGSRAATNVVVADTVDNRLTITGVGQGGQNVMGSVTWNAMTTPALASLAAGATLTFTIDATVNAGLANGTVISNVGRMGSTEVTPPFQTAPANITITAAPLITARKTVADVNGAPFRPGDTVRYSLTLTNTGDGPATNVTIIDPVDPSLTFLTASNGGMGGAGNVFWTIPSLATGAGNAVTLTFDARINTPLDNGTTVSNQARVTSAEVPTPVLTDDPALPGASDPTRFTVTSAATLTMTKTVSDLNGSDTLPNDEVRYTLTLTNTGDAVARNVVVTDVVDNRLTAIVAETGGTLTGQTVTWNVASIASGMPVTLTFRARVVFPLPNGTIIPNQANAALGMVVVASDDPGTPAANDPTNLLVQSRPILTVTKAVTNVTTPGPVFRPGNRIAYDITVRNSGSENATNVVLTDPLDARLTSIDVGTNGTLTGNTARYDRNSLPGLASVAPNTAVTVRILATIVLPLDNGVTISNVTTGVADTLTPVPSDDPNTPAALDPTVITITSAPVLAATKSVQDLNGGSFVPGDAVRFTIAVTNTGTAIARNAILNDPVDARLRNPVPSAGGAAVAGGLRWESPGVAGLLALAPGSVVTVTFDATLESPLDDGTIINNQARFSSDGVMPVLSDDPSTPAALDPTSIRVTSAADLFASTKEILNQAGMRITQATPGTPLRYRITVLNRGNAVARNVIVEDQLPAEWTQATVDNGGTLTGSLARWTPAQVPALANVAPGDSIVLEVRGQLVVPLDDGTVVGNQGRLLPNNGLGAPFVTDDPATPAASDQTRVTVRSSPVLTATKTFTEQNGPPVEPGEQVTYTLSISNTGTATARTIVVTDVLDANLEVVSIGNGGTAAGNTVTWQAGTLAPNATATQVTAVVRVRNTAVNGTVVSNQGSITAQGAPAVLTDDPNTGAANDPTRFTVQSIPRLVVVKTLPAGAPRIVAPLDNVTYQLSITNVGSANATAVTLRDELPLGVTFVSATEGGTFEAATRTVRWNLPNIMPFGGEIRPSVTVLVDDTVADGQVLSNQAFGNAQSAVEAPSDDPTTPAVNDPTNVTVRAVVDLTTFGKTVADENGGTLLPGDVVLYTLTVVNTGTTAARSVTVTDTLDASLEVISADQGGVVGGNTITWSETGTPAFARLRPVNGPVTLLVRARVRPDVTDGTAIPNQATVRSLELVGGEVSDDPATAANNDPTVIRVSAPRVVATKTVTDVNGGTPIPGDTIRYTIVVENLGTAGATGVRVEDDLPTQLENITLSNGGTLTGQTAAWTLGALASGQRAEVTVDARVNPLTDGTAVITNRANIRRDGTTAVVQSDDPTTPAPDATVLRLMAMPTFAGSTITIDGNPPLVKPADPIRFTVTLTNSGTSVANGVTLTAALDPFIANAVVEDGGLLTGGVPTWDASSVPALAQLRPGQTVVVHFRGNVRTPAPDGARISQRARARAVNVPETVIGPAEVVISSRGRFSASSLEVTDVNSGEVEPGDLLNYRLTVLNDGTAVGRNVGVTLPTPAGTRYVTGSTRVMGQDRADIGGDSALGAGVTLGDMEPRAAIVATFQVRVLTEVPRGYRISGQAQIRADELDTVSSDDPRTPEVVGDPTDVVVGGGAFITAVLTADPAVTLANGVTTLRLAVENPGSLPAHDVLIAVSQTARLASGATFTPGSVLVNGMPASDAVDGDAAALTGGALAVRINLLESGQALVVTVGATLTGNSQRAEFQGTITRPGVGEQQTDGDPSRAGAQPTVVSRTGAAADLAGSGITLVDVNGGTLREGEEVLVTATLTNRGGAAATLRTADGFSAPVETPLNTVTGSVQPATLFTFSGARVSLAANMAPSIPAGEQLTVTWRARVAASTADGTVVRATALVTLDDGRQFPLGPVNLTVGAIPGTASLRGTVYEDVGGRNRRFDPDRDRAAVGYQVLLLPTNGGPNAAAVMSSVTDDHGLYELSGVAPGDYRVSVRSRGGAQFAQYVLSALGGGERRTENLRIDPSGVIYDSRDGSPLGGVQVILYREDADEDPSNDVPVNASDLPPGQQDQVTGPDGRYRFDPFAGRYRIGLSGPQPTSVWPSAVIPVANDDNSTHPLGSFARTDSDGNVVPGEDPDLRGTVRYYLRFDLQSPDRPVLRNHIPVDPLLSHVRLTKLANKRMVNVGDIVTYTVRVTNSAPQDFTVAGMGGVEVADSIPLGFSYLKGSARFDRIVRDGAGRVRRELLPTPNPAGSKLLSFGPVDLMGRTELELRYQLVVGPSTRFGQANNRALARTAAGQVAVSNVAEAGVEVRPETLFDDGTVVGKVFCDQNADGWQDSNEEGVFGVRVMLDNGFYAETDEHGRFHFTTVLPGTHLAKIDDNTLPPGANMTTFIRQTFYVTRGLPSRISFGVSCVRNEARNPEVTLNKDAYPPPYVPPPPVASIPDQVHVHGVLTQRLAFLNGSRQESLRADLGVAFGNQDPLIGQGPGPNLMAFDAAKGLGMPLSFHPRITTSLPLTGWRLLVEDEDSHDVVWAMEGDDAPPMQLEWTGRDDAGTLKLQTGHRYIATLVVVATNGDLGMSAPRRFGIRVGETSDAPGYEAFLDEAAGPLFNKKKKPDARLMAWLREEAPKLGDISKAMVDVEIHGDDQTKDLAEQQRRADFLKKQLITLGFADEHITATGFAGDNARVPNMGKAGRAKNRRVVIRSRLAKAMGEPLAPVEAAPRLNINGKDVSLAEDGNQFETDIPLFVGELVRVDLGTPKGQRIVMTRMYTGQPFPLGAPAPPGGAGLDVRGDVADGKLALGDTQLGVLPASTVSAEVTDQDKGPFVVDDQGVPDREITFATRAPADTQRWTLRIISDVPVEGAALDAPAPVAPAAVAPSPSADGGVATPDADGGAPVDDANALAQAPIFAPGAVVLELSGEGAPPETLKWSGQNTAGQSVLKPGVLRYRLAVDLPGGSQFHTPDGYLLVAGKSSPVVLNNAFSKDGKKLTMAAKMALGGIMEQYSRLGGTIRVTAHTDAGKPRMKALFETQQQADAVKQALLDSGVPEASIVALGKGFNEPAVVGTSKRAREMNRRVELAVDPGGGGLPSSPASQPPVVEVNGQRIPVTGTTFGTHTFLTRSGDVFVLWRLATGERVVIKHHPVLPDAKDAPHTLAQVLGPVPTTTLLPLPTGYVIPGVAAVASDGGTLNLLGWEEGAPAVDGGTPTTAVAGTYWAPGGVALAVMAPTAPDAGVAADAGPTREYLPDPNSTLAANLVADLPPDGARLGIDRVMVRGMTSPLNQVRVNGVPATVDPESGQFIAIAQLQEGQNTLTVETEDVRGNKGTIKRNVTVDTTGFFLMGFADTAVAAGARLDEFGPTNSIAPSLGRGGFSWNGGPFTLYGRGVLYAKGRWHGFWRIPFIEATLHIDTQRFADPIQERDLLGQFVSYYPTFGDRALEVQDARARYPLYVRVKGGNNEFTVGNTTAQLQNADLFRYGRARYTAMTTVDQGYLTVPANIPFLGGKDAGHTRLKLFVAGGDSPRRPAHVELRGTGGSIYFLKDRYIVEGSERVYVVVRDAITGQELMRVQKMRNQDYTVRYVEGRVFLNMPLPSTADGAYITNQNPTSVTTGNPVFLVVDYEHMGTGDFSQFAVGGSGEQVILDHVAVGGGYVFEGRRGAQPNYQLGGVHARAFYDLDNYVQAEWAYSRAVNVENAISNDGGLSYQPLGQAVNAGPVLDGNTLYPAERSGHAFKIKGQLALGKVLLGKAPTDLSARAHFQRVQSGFYADGSLFDQGQYKYGAEAFYQFTRHDSARFRWDGIWSEVPLLAQVSQYRRVHREMAVFQLKHVEGPFTLTGEYASNYMEDSAQFGRVNWADFRRKWMNVLASQVDVKVHNNVTFFARQEGVLTADEKLLPRWNDRLTTSVGARFGLMDNLELNITESVRWNGENATAVGLRTKLNDQTDVYAQQRFQYRAGDWVSTSVVGAGQNTDKDSRAYGEYQLDTGSRMQQSRAVMGISHAWTLFEGVNLSVGYERTHVLGTSGTAPGVGPPTAGPNGQPIPNAFGDSYTFAAPGAVGSNPTFLGSGSRDSMYAQFAFTTFKWLKLQSRFEVRYDNADERRGGFDRLMYFSTNNLTWNWTEDLSFVGRFNLVDVQNRTLNLREAQLQELVAGLAYRPVKHEWFSVLALVRHRLELRPIMLTEGRFERTVADVASIEPILELPFGLQLVEKLAFKWSRERTDDLKEGNAFMALWVNRVNYHAFRMLKRFVPWFNKWPGDIDLAVEYRLRTLITQAQFDHGFVTELGIVPVPYVRIGMGFNFSRISDDEFAKSNQNAFGPYIRMQATY